MTIEQMKTDLIRELSSIDKDKLSLPDLRLYAETLKIISDINEKSYFDVLSSMTTGFGLGKAPATLAEMKGE